ncbi:MAG: GNAT family N-acetyltransferase [Actinomycetota bacterium]
MSREAPDIRLVPFDEWHLPGMRDLVRDPDVVRFTRVPEPPPDDFPETWLERYREGRRDGTREAFAIIERDDSFMGIAVAPEIDGAARTVELGYVIHPEARGRGVATESLRQLTAWAFAELEPRRIQLIISPENGASKRAAERNGYRCEGTLRSIHVKQDVWDDAEIWSRLPTDP